MNLRTGFVLVFSLLTLGLSACGDGDNDNNNMVSPDVPPPAFPMSEAQVVVNEGVEGVVFSTQATSPNGNEISYQLRGNDSDRFTLEVDDAGMATLSFSFIPNFELPFSVDGNNIYFVILDAAAIAADNSGVSDVVSLPIQVIVADIDVGIEQVALGLTMPLFATGAGDDSGRLFVVQQTGEIRILQLDTTPGPTLLPEPFLDISSDVSTGGEQGLLGLAFAPNYGGDIDPDTEEVEGIEDRFYVNLTNTDGDTEIREYRVSGGDANEADLSSGRILLTIPQPFPNHNGGWIGFGPDGFLYIATGDGGSGGDPQNNAQNRENLLGAILRIDPFSDDFPDDDTRNYAIPETNPFLDEDDNASNEIFAYGLRNPFRASFDRELGNFYIGDVGQSQAEEINRIPNGSLGGENFGWNAFEGTLPFPNEDEQNPLQPEGAVADFPIIEYRHEDQPTGGASVVGGYVHRGDVLDLKGEYVFSDFVSGNVWSVPVGLLADGFTLEMEDFTVRTEALTTAPSGPVDGISSFGEDDDGNLYIVSLFRGEIYRIVDDLSDPFVPEAP